MEKPPMTTDDLSPTGPVQPIVLRSWPKIVMMTPTLLAAFICGVVTAFADVPARDAQFGIIHLVNLVFMLVLGINLAMLLYDLSLRGFLIIALLIVCLVLAIFLVDRSGALWEQLGRAFGRRVYANSSFYFLFTLILLCNLAVAWVITRFHYWVVDHNEIIIHHGFMEEQERHPTNQARFTLQIEDVLEYGLFGSGTLVFTFADDRKEYSLHAVLRVRSKAMALDKLLGRIAVTEH